MKQRHEMMLAEGGKLAEAMTIGFVFLPRLAFPTRLFDTCWLKSMT